MELDQLVAVYLVWLGDRGGYCSGGLGYFADKCGYGIWNKAGHSGTGGLLMVYAASMNNSNGKIFSTGSGGTVRRRIRWRKYKYFL